MLVLRMAAQLFKKKQKPKVKNYLGETIVKSLNMINFKTKLLIHHSMMKKIVNQMVRLSEKRKEFFKWAEDYFYRNLTHHLVAIRRTLLEDRYKKGESYFK